MKTNLFKKEYIKREVELAKNNLNHSLFHHHLEQILKEQEELNPTPEVPEQTSPNPEDPTESALPPEDTVPVLQLTKLAVEALFVDLETLRSGNIKELIHDLNEMRPIPVAQVSAALSLIQRITSEAQIPVSQITDLDKVNFSSKNLLINLIAQCLFLSKDDLLESDPSLASLMEKISDDFTQLKELEKEDPIQALKIADQIQENIKKIIPSASLTI
jgi:hypothetical protein